MLRNMMHNHNMSLEEMKHLIKKMKGKEKRSHNFVWIGIGIGIITAAILGAVWMLFFRKQDETDDGLLDAFESDECEDYDDHGCICQEEMEEEIDEIQKEELAEKLEKAMQTEFDDVDEDKEE